MMTSHRILLQNKEKNSNVFSQIKFLKKELGIPLFSAIKIAWNISFKSRTVILELDKGGGDIRNFDNFYKKACNSFHATYQIVESFCPTIDRSKFEQLLKLFNSNKDVNLWMSYYKGV